MDPMDIGAASLGVKRSAPAEIKPAAKAKTADKKKYSSDQYAELLAQVAKLSLSTARQVATLNSITIDAILVQKLKVEEITTGLKEISKAYFDSTKNKSPQERNTFGSPHIYIWHELLSIVCKMANNEDHKPTIAAIKAHVEDLDNRTNAEVQGKDVADLQHIKREQTQMQVKVCKYGKCWNQDLMKLECSTVAGTTARAAQEAVYNFLREKAGGTIKTGQAPRGDLERKIGKKLADMGYTSQNGTSQG
eukprot:TRINITY_DN60487_c0_g2_i1.p2 TRINITY_DN60487_c0_g2~~TRINITY_DN60487_c0_g2_i1.p2  ORF type:complete len:249 (+),score=85.02 TRINITY_DN60487_c0_g2_i1:117-863(+)